MGYINGYRRKLPTMGTLYEQREQLNPLPPVGAYVRIEEIHVRSTKDRNGDFAEYRPYRRFFDPWGIPKLLKVKGYSKSVNDPYNRNSQLYLEWIAPSGQVFNYTFPTLYIACGNIRCVVEELQKDNEVELFFMREDDD